MSARSEPRELTLLGCKVIVDDALGHAAIEHDGELPWNYLWAIKNHIWGSDAVAIELLPPAGMLIDSRPCRHIWRLGEGEFWPDLLGRSEPQRSNWKDSLEARYHAAWDEARG